MFVLHSRHLTFRLRIRQRLGPRVSNFLASNIHNAVLWRSEVKELPRFFVPLEKFISSDFTSRDAPKWWWWIVSIKCFEETWLSANMINGLCATGEGHFNSRDRSKKVVISVKIHQYVEQWLALMQVIVNYGSVEHMSARLADMWLGTHRHAIVLRLSNIRHNCLVEITNTFMYSRNTRIGISP